MKNSTFKVVLSRLTTLNLETSLICRIFKEFGLSLDVLGTDILNIFKNSQACDLYKQALLVDLIEMAQLCAMDTTAEEIEEEFTTIMSELEEKKNILDGSNCRLVNVHFDGIDTVIFEYFTTP